MEEPTRNESLRKRLFGVMVVVWVATFGIVGIGSLEATNVCALDSRADSVDGYHWDRDRYNDCAWTLYSGTYPIRSRASDSAYLESGLVPPPNNPPLDPWQAVMILGAAAITGPLALWRWRLQREPDAAIPLATASADAGP
jgi:hypothetical protein